jgi:hypothetical protein
MIHGGPHFSICLENAAIKLCGFQENNKEKHSYQIQIYIRFHWPIIHSISIWSHVNDENFLPTESIKNNL